MSVLLRESESKSEAKAASKSDAEQGKVYEQLLCTLLVKNCFELSKSGIFKDGEFSIGRKLNMMLDIKFDDIVFSYRGMDDTKNLVFVQVKHKQDESQMIDCKILSAEEWEGKGNLQESFNLQKYFISFLRIREELKDATSEELKDGKIKYVVIYTNIGLNAENLDLKSNDDDDSLNHIKCIFSFGKYPINSYQFNSLSDELRSILEKSSDLHRIARELAQYVVWKKYKKKNILGKEETAVNLYQVVLEREVIRKSTEKLYMEKEKEQYCVAYFRDEFIDNEEPGSKKELRDAIFQAMTELAESETDTSEDGLKSVLKKVEMKVTVNFGKIKHKKTTLPCEWGTVEQSDIDEFLKCFVFLVNQSNVTDLKTLIHSEKDSILKGTNVKQAVDHIYPKFRDRIEKALGLHEKASRTEMWLSGEKIMQLVQEKKEATDISLFTSRYECKVMKYGEFIHLGELEAILDSFLSYKMSKEEGEVKDRHILLKESKVLSVCSEITLLSTIKILQFLNAKNYREENGYISIELSNLIKMRDRVEKAFSSETYKLLIIECRDKVNIQNAEEICRRFSGIIESKQHKKIILINKQGERNILAERFIFYLKKRFQNDCDPEKMYVQETDDINLKYFVPSEDPFEKKVIVFQGQEKKLSLAELIGFKNWNSYVDYIAQDKILNKADIADAMIEVIKKNAIEVGSKPPGTSSLEGAYAELFEKIDKDTLLCNLLGSKYFENTTANKKLENDRLENDIYALPTFVEEINLDNVAENLDNGADEIYIFGEIGGSNRKEKVEKLEEYLGLNNKQKSIDNMVGDIHSDSKIQIADDELKHEDFKRICFNKPEKRIFWIGIKYDENGRKFILRQMYNPIFYLKRNFKQIIAMKEVKEKLIEKCFSETFIFCCVENEQVLIDSLKFSNESEKGRFKKHCKTGEIKFFTEESDAKAKFYELCKHNKVIHFFKFINKDLTEIFFIKEHNLIKEIKDKKVVIIAGEPGMGKTTTLTKLYTKIKSEAFDETHWVIRINLKYHIHAIREINLINTLSVVNFLLTIDLKLNHNIAKTLLAVALDKKEKFLKPLLLAFDGFDEILDEEVRNNVISLLKFLKEESAAKLWITTSLLYKKILENELSTFALEFDPMDDDFKVAYVKQYLEDRLCLSEKKIIELFVQDNEKQVKVQKYTSEFLDKMKSVFTGNICRIIGTPLQLYLMLDGSARHFREWIGKEEAENLTFNYLGYDLWEVYEKFIARKYEFYFLKKGIRECLRQKASKFIIDQYNDDLAMSLILGVEPKNSLEEFKDTVLSSGIIESDGKNIEFIHTTFRDYFAAKVFVQWMEKRPSVVSNSFKKKYILKEILRKPDYPLIRSFINVKLNNVIETKRFEECLRHYGVIIEKMLEEEKSSLIDEKGTVLHVAANEGNKNIVYFLLKSLKGHTDVLKKFIFIPDKHERTALDLARNREDDEIVKLFDTETELLKGKDDWRKLLTNAFFVLFRYTNIIVAKCNSLLKMKIT